MHRWALAPRNRSANQNAPIAINDRRNIPPHARKVDVKLAVMTSSDNCGFLDLSVLATSGSLPCLSCGTFHEVHLTAVAWCASKRSQVSAPHARLNHRQSHRTPAGGAQWPFILLVEHTLFPYWAGARHSQSPLDADTGRDGASLLFGSPELLVNIAHFQKLNGLGPRRGICSGRFYLSPVQSGLTTIGKHHEEDFLSDGGCRSRIRCTVIRR